MSSSSGAGLSVAVISVSETTNVCQPIQVDGFPRPLSSKATEIVIEIERTTTMSILMRGRSFKLN